MGSCTTTRLNTDLTWTLCGVGNWTTLVRVIEEREALDDTAFYGSERYIETHTTFISGYSIDYSGYLYNDYLGTTYNGFSYTRPTTSYARQFVYGNYIDEAIVLDVLYSNGSLEARYFYHHDTQYSVVGLTNDSGTLVEAYQYDPYGKHLLLSDGSDSDTPAAVNFNATDTRTVNAASASVTYIGNPYTFTGRRFDPETGLHNFRNRYYSSGRGRFISRDPIGYFDGANLYAAYFVPNGADALGLNNTLAQAPPSFIASIHAQLAEGQLAAHVYNWGVRNLVHISQGMTKNEAKAIVAGIIAAWGIANAPPHYDDTSG